MKKIITAIALCSVVLSMASCTRGGNIDRGDDGYLGHHGDRHENTTDVSDTDRDERRYHNGIEDDIYNLPRDIRHGLDNAGRDVHNGLRNAEDNLRDGLNRGGTTHNNDIIK